MKMTIPEFIEYLERVKADLTVDINTVRETLQSIIKTHNLDPIDVSHLHWEVMHAINSYLELKNDFGRIISTLQGKGFDKEQETDSGTSTGMW